MYKESYLIHLGQNFWRKFNQLIDRFCYPSITATLVSGINRYLKNSYCGQLMSRDFVAESRGYRSFQQQIVKLETCPKLLRRSSVPLEQAEVYPFYFSYFICLTLAAILAFILLPISVALQALACCVGLGLVLYRAEYGLYLAALALPFVPFKALFLLAGFTLFALFLHWRNGAKYPLSFSATWIPLLLWLLVLLYATLTSVSFWTSVSELMIPVTGLLFMFLMVCLLDEPKKLENIVLALCMAGLLTAVYAIYQYYTGPEMSTLEQSWVDPNINPDLKNRAYAILGNPNLLGQYMVLMASISLGGFLGIKGWRQKGLCLATALFSVYCLLLTFSRGGLIAFLAAMVFLGFFWSQRGFLTLLPFGALGVYYFTPSAILTRLSTITGTSATGAQDSSTLYRLDTWSTTFALLQEHWVTGVGLGRLAFSRIYSTHMINSTYVPHSHNLYLQLLSEFGILGLALFAWIFWRIFRIALHLRRSTNSFIRCLNAGLLAACVGFFAHSFIDYFLWHYTLALMLWLVVGMFLVLERFEKKEKVGGEKAAATLSKVKGSAASNH